MEPGLFHVFQASRGAGNETTCTCALNCFDIYPRVLGQKRLERVRSVPPEPEAVPAQHAIPGTALGEGPRCAR